MGVLVSTGVHYGRNGGCLAALVLADNPPDYDTLDLRVAVAGPAFEDVPAVPRDASIPITTVTDGTWHYANACPAA